MTREKISQLACQCNAYRYINRAAKDEPTYTFSLDKLEAFYHAAQAEAFEAVAELCSNNFDMTGHYLAYRIREMAKEMK